jgi:hypothetical protein
VITPSKFISLDQSVLAHLDSILEEIGEDCSIRGLYRTVNAHFDSVDQFLLAVDVLYILGRINVDFRNSSVSHAN